MTEDNTASMLDRVLDWWFKPFAVQYIRIYEVLMCLTMVYYFGGYMTQMEWWIGDMGFHPSAAATSSHYLPPPPRPSAEWFSPIVTTFYFLVGIYLIGYGRRILNWVFFALAVYVQAMDQPSAFTINRMLILYFFMLGLQPFTKTVTDVAGKSKEVVSGWIVRIIQLTLTIQYTASGFCKMHGDWLDDSTLVRLNIVWTQSQGHYKNLISAWAVNDLPMPIWGMLAVTTLVFETGAVVFFFWKRTRLWTVFLGLMMHVAIAILMKDLIYFSMQMMMAYVFFLPESWVERIADWRNWNVFRSPKTAVDSFTDT